MWESLFPPPSDRPRHSIRKPKNPTPAGLTSMTIGNDHTYDPYGNQDWNWIYGRSAGNFKKKKGGCKKGNGGKKGKKKKPSGRKQNKRRKPSKSASDDDDDMPVSQRFPVSPQPRRRSRSESEDPFAMFGTSASTSRSGTYSTPSRQLNYSMLHQDDDDDVDHFMFMGTPSQQLPFQSTQPTTMWAGANRANWERDQRGELPMVGDDDDDSEDPFALTTDGDEGARIQQRQGIPRHLREGPGVVQSSNRPSIFADDYEDDDQGDDDQGDLDDDEEEEDIYVDYDESLDDYDPDQDDFYDFDDLYDREADGSLTNDSWNDLVDQSVYPYIQASRSGANADPRSFDPTRFRGVPRSFDEITQERAREGARYRYRYDDLAYDQIVTSAGGNSPRLIRAYAERLRNHLRRNIPNNSNDWGNGGHRMHEYQMLLNYVRNEPERLQEWRTGWRLDRRYADNALLPDEDTDTDTPEDTDSEENEFENDGWIIRDDLDEEEETDDD